MAEIIENCKGRRSIKLSVDDVISIVRAYQTVSRGETQYEKIRLNLAKSDFYLPEDF